jgi:hypothetical protein
MEERLAARALARVKKEALRAAERAAEEERLEQEGPFSSMRRQARARLMAVSLVQQMSLQAAATAEEAHAQEDRDKNVARHLDRQNGGSGSGGGPRRGPRRLGIPTPALLRARALLQARAFLSSLQDVSSPNPEYCTPNAQPSLSTVRSLEPLKAIHP